MTFTPTNCGDELSPKTAKSCVCIRHAGGICHTASENWSKTPKPNKGAVPRLDRSLILYSDYNAS